MAPLDPQATLAAGAAPLSLGSLSAKLPGIPTPSPFKLSSSPKLSLQEVGKTAARPLLKGLGVVTAVVEGLNVLDQAHSAGEASGLQGKGYLSGFKDKAISGGVSSATTIASASAAATLTNAVIIVGVTALAATPPGWFVTGLVIGGAMLGGYLASSTGFSERVGNAAQSIFSGQK